MNGDYLERLEYHLGAYREDDDSEFIDNPVAYRWLTVGDQRAAVAELKRLRAKVASLDDCLTATAVAKGSNRYAGQGQLITLLTVDDVREMIREWCEDGDGDA